MSNQNDTKIPEDLKNVVDYVMKYAYESTDWLKIRAEIITQCHAKVRKHFTRRHYSTKLTILNDVDYAIIKYWESKTGNRLFIDQDKLHSDDKWTGKGKPADWKLQEINEKRRKNKKFGTAAVHNTRASES